MRIAIICKTFLKGGAEKQALILARLLVEKDVEVYLFNWYGDRVDQKFLTYINDNSFIYYPLLGTHLTKFMHFKRIVKEKNISILVSYLTLSNLFSGLTRLMNNDTISIGGIRNEKLPWYKLFFERFIHNYVNDATVFNSFSAKNNFTKRGFKNDKIFVIQNAIELTGEETEKRAGNGEVRIITVGRFVKQKDYSTALFSFRKLLEERNDVRLKYCIVGYGPLEKQIRSLAEHLQIDSHMEFIINPVNVPEILKKSDIFLSTSLFEGVSNSIMEAMVAGLPIVATDVGDNKYLIRNGRNGYLVPIKDVEKVVNRLDYLVGSEEIRNEYGKNHRQILENEFSERKLLENYLELFKHLQLKKKEL